MFLISSGCATTAAVSLPAATHVLGAATRYLSETGARLEIIHDSRAGVAILKLPDGTLTVVPAEFAGVEGRYKDTRMTVWEHENGVLLWIDGKVAFSGTMEE